MGPLASAARGLVGPADVVIAASLRLCTEPVRVNDIDQFGCSELVHGCETAVIGRAKAGAMFREV